jgi:hypothetical protein
MTTSFRSRESQEIERLAVRAGWSFAYGELIDLVGHAKTDGETFYRAWRCFLEHGAKLVKVTPGNFLAAYDEWVRLSGPAVTRWT